MSVAWLVWRRIGAYSVSLPRTSMEVSLGQACSSFASCSPSEGVSAASRKSMKVSTLVVRAKSQPASRMMRAAPRAFQPRKLSSVFSSAESSRRTSLVRMRCR